MPKITASDLKDLGFIAEAFGRTANDFDTYLTGLIGEQSGVLESRIGSAAYAASEPAMANLVKRAEKALCAAELLQRRLNRLSLDSNAAEGMDSFKLRRSKQEYLQEVDSLVGRIAAGAPVASGSDYAGSIVVSSHFEGAEST